MEILHNISLRNYNTFGIDAQAESFAEITSVNDLHLMLQSASILPAPEADGDLLVLGGGSNILFTRDFDGLVLKNSISGIELIKETEDQVLLRCGAGEVWDDLVRFCVEKGYGGLENLSGIPGCAGASPIQNIGAYGVEMRDCFESLEAFDLKDGQVLTIHGDECEFGYRDSIFKRKWKGRFIILSVSFMLQKTPVVNLNYRALNAKFSGMKREDITIRRIREAVLEIRASKLPDPALIGNAGSFFKNPVVEKSVIDRLLESYPEMVYYRASAGEFKIAAGWLIEKAGWKGFREGDAGVHQNQALVIVNHGNASGGQILALAMKVRDSIKEKFGILLEPEVQVY